VSEAVTEQTRGRRKTLIGTVVSVKMDKTAVVAVERRYPHPLYHKIIRSTKRYKAHDPNNAAVLGDTVRIVESRPISKQKRWRIMETMTRGNVAELQPREIGVPEEAAQVRQATVAPVVPQTPTVAQVADETPMTSDSTVLQAASDDMDARDYASTPGAPMLDADEPATEAENVTPDVTVAERDDAATSAAEASADETPMSSESDVLAAASDDMDAKDYDVKDGAEEDKA
jgi:small subunit ribosomal protein S17